MNDRNQGISSAPEEQTLKRKRGRPPKDDNVNGGNSTLANESSDEEHNAVTEDELLGQVVSGVLSGTFDAGYFLTVKPQNSDINLTGLVFCPGKVLPITPENDLAPKEIMFKRISPVNELVDSTQKLEKNNQLGFQTPNQVPSTSASKSETKNAALMVECDPENDASYSLKGHDFSDQGYSFGMGSYYTPVVEHLQDYRIVDHDEIMKEFEASACMNAPSSASKPADYRLESMSELQSVYPENLINNDVSRNQESAAVDPCLKLMDSNDGPRHGLNPACSGFTQVANCPLMEKSFDVNEKPSIDDNIESETRSTMLLNSMEPVRPDLQLGFTEAKYSSSAKASHFLTEDQPSSTVETKNPDKPYAAPFFYNLTAENSSGANKKSVTESLSFTLADDAQATLKANDSSSDQITQEAVASELKLSATVTPP